METDETDFQQVEAMSLTSMVTQLLHEDTLENFVQELSCRNCKKEEGIKLLELNSELLSIIEEGKPLYFKGDPKEYLTLCTDSKTFQILYANNSNSLLLYDNLKLSKKIPMVDDKTPPEKCGGIGVFHSYMEARECRPKLKKLISLLQESMYNGPEYEQNIEKETLYDWEKLRSSIQASDGEIKKAFSEYLIAEVDGFYRLISFDYEAKSLTMILDFVEENSWEMNEINKEETFEALSQLIIRPIFDVIFNKYTKLNNGNNLYVFDEKKVCKCVAEILLSASPSTEYGDFMEAWRMAVSEKMTPKEEYLYGLAVIVQNADLGTNDVVSFPEKNLPDNISARFNKLFSVKKKWTYEEIAPYLSNLECTEESVSSLLTENTRSSKINDVRYYNAKYPLR